MAAIPDRDQYPEVYMFAATSHRQQRRKNADADPYINHPIEVANLVSKYAHTGYGPVYAAVLHDVIEDCGVTYEHIASRFGIDIANMVREVTDDKSLPKNERKRLQIAHMNSPSMSLGAKYIKLADKYSNLSTLLNDPPVHWSPEFISGTIYWSYAVCKPAFKYDVPLVHMVKELFTTLGVDLSMGDDKLQEKLEAYYKLCED